MITKMIKNEKKLFWPGPVCGCKFFIMVAHAACNGACWVKLQQHGGTVPWPGCCHCSFGSKYCLVFLPLCRGKAKLSWALHKRSISSRPCKRASGHLWKGSKTWRLPAPQMGARPGETELQCPSPSGQTYPSRKKKQVEKEKEKNAKEEPMEEEWWEKDWKDSREDLEWLVARERGWVEWLENMGEGGGGSSCCQSKRRSEAACKNQEGRARGGEKCPEGPWGEVEKQNWVFKAEVQTQVGWEQGTGRRRRPWSWVLWGPPGWRGWSAGRRTECPTRRLWQLPRGSSSGSTVCQGHCPAVGLAELAMAAGQGQVCTTFLGMAVLWVRTCLNLILVWPGQMEQAYGTTWPNAQASIWQPTAQASNAQASTCQTPAKPQLMGPICSTPPAHSPQPRAHSDKVAGSKAAGTNAAGGGEPRAKTNPNPYK